MPEAIEARGAEVSDSNVQDRYPGLRNIDANPKFHSFGNYDRVLWPGSPGIDSGTGEDDRVDGASINPA